MQDRRKFLVRTGVPTLAAMAAIFALVLVSQSQAQQPATKAPAKAQQKQKGPTPPAPQQHAGQEQQPEIVYSPWMKFCQKGPDANARQVCFTGRDGHVE